MIYEFIFVQAPRRRFDLEHSFGHISPHVPEKGGVETSMETMAKIMGINFYPGYQLLPYRIEHKIKFSAQVKWLEIS